jgi:extracellular matrix regulatory protein A
MQTEALSSRSSGATLDVGFGNTVPKGRVVGILSYDSGPLKRHCHELEKLHRVIDATKGRKVKSIIFLDSSHVVLSAVARETLAERFESST